MEEGNSERQRVFSTNITGRSELNQGLIVLVDRRVNGVNSSILERMTFLLQFAQFVELQLTETTQINTAASQRN